MSEPNEDERVAVYVATFHPRVPGLLCIAGANGLLHVVDIEKLLNNPESSQV